MNVYFISGSRNPEGQTAQAINALARGIEAGGGTTERVFLPELVIERCRQCENDGWGECRAQGHCVIEDDFDDVVDKLLAADVVVFATPVYFSDLSESLRAFMDRLRRTSIHESTRSRLAGHKVLGLCVAGGGGGGAPQCCVDLLWFLNVCGFNTLDMIPVRRQTADLKRQVLETTGRWLATADLSNRQGNH